ncbi:MAG: type II secretion system protein GspD [Armatimonadetes bacterium]|nr:type II secretion system protein GspD [Armatimonadota bacterium]
MKKVLWLALTLSLVGIVASGDAAPAFASGQATPVSGSRAVSGGGAFMSVGRGGTIRTPTAKKRYSSRSRRSRSRSYAASRNKRRVAPVQARRTPTPTNSVTGVAVVPEETTVRLVIEGTEAFTPAVTTAQNGGNTVTIVSVPGKLGGDTDAGSVAIHKNGISTVRYASQAGQVRFVADATAELQAELTPSADQRHWEIVLRRATVTPTQVAIDTTGGKTIPLPAPKKTASVVFKPAIAREGEIKPVTVKLPAAPAFLPQRSPITPRLVGQTPVPGTGEDKRVSLDVVAADINDVIKALALQSGVNIVTSTEVKGTVTVSLKRIPMIEALDTITRLSGFSYARLDNKYIVGSPESVTRLTAVKRDVILVTDYIRYRYVSSNDLYSTLRNKFPGINVPATGATNDGDPARSKLLVLNDTTERIGEVREFVRQLEIAASDTINTQVTELYKIKAANAQDLIRLTQQLAPTVIIQVGASQLFQPSGTGQSASFSPGGTLGNTGVGGGLGAGLGATQGAGAGAGQGATAPGTATGGPANTAQGSGVANTPNTLVLTGSPADIAKAREILERIDVRTPQIAYEARVVDVNREDLQQLGIRYDFSRQAIVGERNETGQGTVGLPASSQTAGNPNFGAIFRSPYTIGATLDALANRNRARTLASPNLSAIDGQPATAFIGDQIKYVVSIQQTPQGQTVQTETASVGITLRVTGKASPDGYITLYVHPEVSSITSFRDLPNGISLPQIATRFVDTTVRVKSGETIAIGGLLREVDINNLQKIPIIGDIPFLGQLFRRSQKTKQRSEIVVFVTARATDDGT